MQAAEKQKPAPKQKGSKAAKGARFLPLIQGSMHAVAATRSWAEPMALSLLLCLCVRTKA